MVLVWFGAHFDYQLDMLELTKSVYLLSDSDTLALVYEFNNVQKPVLYLFSLRWKPSQPQTIGSASKRWTVKSMSPRMTGSV